MPAGELTKYTAETVATILADTAVACLPAARRLLKLQDVDGASPLAAACCRFNRFSDPTYKAVKVTLQNSQMAEIFLAPRIVGFG